MKVKKPKKARYRDGDGILLLSDCQSLPNRENLALNSYLFLGDLKLFPGFIRTKGFFAFIVIVYFKWKSIFIFCFSGSFPNKRKLLGQAF